MPTEPAVTEERLVEISSTAPIDKIDWRISRSCNGGACIMVARDGDNLLIGNSKTPNGAVYTYTRREWLEFVEGAKKGDFDGIA